MATENQKTEVEAAAELAFEPRLDILEDVPHMLLPKHIELKSLEHLLPAPKRIKGIFKFEEPQSFARYIGEFKENGSRVFADFDKYRFLAVINGAVRDKPAHSDHRVTLEMTTTQEWKAWVKQSGQKMQPREFAIFLENHIKEITGNFSGGDLLGMCRALRVNVKAGMTADESASKGKRSLTFSANTEVRAQRAADGAEIAFPETIEITLRVFNHVQPYVFEPRLRWDANDKGIVFWYDLIDSVIVERAAFEQVVAEVNGATTLPAYVGWAVA